MAPDVVLEVGIAPDGALARLSAAINQRPKRAFGVVKTQNEFLGSVAHDRFEIWERSQHAVHAVGEVKRTRGGTRVELSFVITPITRALVGVFFALYALVAAGLATGPPDTPVTPVELVAAVGGAALLGGAFALSARRQRADLRRFVESVLSGAANVAPPGRTKRSAG